MTALYTVHYTGMQTIDKSRIPQIKPYNITLPSKIRYVLADFQQY